MVCAFIIALAVLLTVVACWLALARQFSTWTRTFGTVILVTRDVSDRQSTFAPVIQFSTAAGKKVTFTASYSSGSVRFSEGDSVRILFDPKSPTSASIDGLTNKYFPFMVAFAMTAGLTLLFGIVVFHR